MALDNRIGTKVEKTFRKEDAAGVRVDPYPYVGVVKNNLDPTRTGRLQVWIPNLGGDADDAQNWRTVSYASPFMGTTNQKTKNTQNSYTSTSHTYGMWMVPPDIGVEVIVIFIGGMPDKGYWIACVNSSISRHMMPGMASSTHLDTAFASAATKKAITKGYQYPVTEFNTNETAVNLTNFTKLPKPIHEEQFTVLVKQGLDRDNTRGTITSSSQRETPSNVFGISTPGRAYGNDPADDPKFAQKVAEGKVSQDDYAVTTRKGGHTFVMDDGSTSGIDQLIRLRTAKGHQIMMHDSDDIMYISNAEGSVWIELNSTGGLDIFSANTVSVRTQGTINMHADRNINMYAGNKINMRAEGTIQCDSAKFNVLTGGSINLQTTGKFESKAGSNYNVQSEATISLKAGPKIILDATNISKKTTPGVVIKDIKMITLNTLPDTTLDTATGLYTVKPGLISSIVTVAPGHEPFYLRVLTPPPPEADAPKIKPKATYTGTKDTTKTTSGSGVTNQVADQDIRNQPEAAEAIGTLSKDETTALMTQIAKTNAAKVAASETNPTTNTDPTLVDATEPDPYAQKDETLGSVGKYQLTHQDLIDLGYVKSSVTGNDQLSDPNSWTGKEGIESLDGYYASPSIQESMMTEMSGRNYNAMLANGSITATDDAETVAGMLSVAHELGPDAAATWRETGSGSGATDAFQAGKYAVAVMAPKVAEINAG